MFKLIGTLPDKEKNDFFNLKHCIDQQDAQLTQSDAVLKNILKYKSRIKEKLAELFIYSRRVKTAEKRCKVGLDVVKKFETNVSNFVKDAIKVYNQCEFADSYHQIDSSDIFLSEMLGCCEERLKNIEDNFKEIQELLTIESGTSHFSMLINTITLMQEKFQLISSVAYDMHKRVSEITIKYSSNSAISKSLAQIKDTKIEKRVEPVKKYSSIKDIITGRDIYSGSYY